MKFQGIPALAVAAGLALLAATPGLGDGTATNAKKPPTDTKKTVTVVKPAIDSGKSSKDKDRQIPKIMPPKNDHHHPSDLQTEDRREADGQDDARGDRQDRSGREANAGR